MTTYDVHLGLIGKRVGDFLLVLIGFFSLDVTAEALQAIICLKSPLLKGGGHFNLKFQIECGTPPTIVRVTKLDPSVFLVV